MTPPKPFLGPTLPPLPWALPPLAPAPAARPQRLAMAAALGPACLRSGDGWRSPAICSAVPPSPLLTRSAPAWIAGAQQHHC